MSPEPTIDDMPAWAVRLEAKVDVALTQHAARLDNHANDLADHEARLRVIESRHYISPAGLWAAVVSAITCAAALVAIVVGVIPD